MVSPQALAGPSGASRDTIEIIMPSDRDLLARIGRSSGGRPTVNDEADVVRFVNPADLDHYDIHPSMRQQIGDYLAGTCPPLS